MRALISRESVHGKHVEGQADLAVFHRARAVEAAEDGVPKRAFGALEPHVPGVVVFGDCPVARVDVQADGDTQMQEDLRHVVLGKALAEGFRGR